MKILVAVDSSDASMVAAREAASRLWPAGTTVLVISVVEPLYDWSTSDLEKALQQPASRPFKAPQSISYKPDWRPRRQS
jgi:hypothetical protein